MDDKKVQCMKKCEYHLSRNLYFMAFFILTLIRLLSVF